MMDNLTGDKQSGYKPSQAFTASFGAAKSRERSSAFGHNRKNSEWVLRVMRTAAAINNLDRRL
jgi:hypothetical protein